ncbi:MAG: type II toxin-antitoxin system RelE/ParE family toxin [Methylococcales bacterium]
MRVYSAVIERCPQTGLFVGFVPGFSGAHSQGETLDELNRNLREVITMLLEDGEPQRVARFVNFETVSRRKLEQLNQAGHVDDLRVPPGNRLEALKGDRAGQYSIHVNDQFRVCFRWTGTDAEDVETVDYH